MTISDKIKRAIALYSAVILFCILLPVILSSALGYKIDLHAFKIYKTGIIYLNSSPSGAAIYLNGAKHNDLTPAQIENLKPGTYKVDVRREGFYPWEKELAVRPNMVTKEEHIVLFPLAQKIKRVARYPLAEFAVSDKNLIYHMTSYGLFVSNMDGTGLRRITPYSNWPKNILGKKFSPSGDRIMYFTSHDIYVIYLNPDKTATEDNQGAKIEQALNMEYPIVDVFWYSDSGYLVVVTEKGINVAELRGGGKQNVVLLYKFNSTPKDLYYDDANDSLYFIDNRKEEGLKEGNYLYRLDLRKNFFGQLMQLLIKKEEPANK